jgi:hypothetical protein
MAMFVGCPRRYKAKYVTKEIKFVTSPALERGSKIHTLMERHCRGHDPVGWPLEESECEASAKKFLETLAPAEKRASGWLVGVERELAIDDNFQAVGFWDPNAILRCKVDLMMIPPDKSKVLLVDWKTGKTPGSFQQLIINALCLVPEYGYTRNYVGAFVYLDKGDLELRDIDLKDRTHRDKVLGLLKIIKEAGESDDFPAVEGDGCRWCEIKEKCRSERGR